MKDKDIYYDKKFLQVRGSDAFNVYRNVDSQEEEASSEAATGGVRARRGAAALRGVGGEEEEETTVSGSDTREVS